MTKLYSIIFYLLSIILGFFIGMVIVTMVGAGKGQGLAAGAIALSYGVVGAFLGFSSSFVVTYTGTRKRIIFLNALYCILIIASVVFFVMKYQQAH